MPETIDAAGKHLEIKKYPNRRYYDATRSQHLTLEDIRDRIREGYDIRVTDSKTGADITAQVLTQIVLELETSKIDSFPVALLSRMIRANDQLVKDFVEKYFNQAFAAYLEYQKQIDAQVRQMHGTAGFFSPFTAWPQGVMNPFAQAGADKSAPAPSASRPEEASDDVRNVIAELQQQVAGLQQGLKKTKRKRTKR